MRFVILVVLTTPVLGGCLSTPLNSTSEPADPPIEDLSSFAHVVVALVDSGIQPYHEVFQAPAGWSPPPIPDAIVLGDDFRDRALSDLEVWNELEPDQLYHFEGTRVFAISKFPSTTLNENAHLIFDDFGTDGHGTGTASVVAQTSPNATIVMVEAQRTLEGAFAWIADQPWIDVVSTSQSRALNLMSDPIEHPDPVAASQKLATERGKLVLNAAGNEPSPTIMGTGGPPWVIAIGGAEERSHGETIMTAKLADFVANTTHERLATKADLSGYYQAGGTSFGTPIVAGVLGETIYQLRQKLGDFEVRDEERALLHAPQRTITNSEILEALNATAVYWETGDYEPTNNTYSDPYARTVTTTAPIVPSVDGTPVGPWLQMGWGYVGPELIPRLTSILLGSAPMPEKPLEARQYMEALARIKTTYWDAWQGL